MSDAASQPMANHRLALSTGARDMPRMSLASACFTLYKLTLRQYMHGKRWLALVLLFLLPAAMALLIRATPHSRVPSVMMEFVLSWVLVPQALLPLIALLYASGVVQDEQEEQTITYLLVRPIPKWLIYIVKIAATWTTTVVLVGILTVLTYTAIYWGSGNTLADTLQRAWRASEIHALSVITYCSLFGLIGLLTRRTLIIGVVYTAIVEGLFANLPLSLRMGTVIYYARLIAIRSLDFTVTWSRGRSMNIAEQAWSLNAKSDPGLTEHPQILTCVLVLLTASLVLTTLGAWICSQSEFHVKTPEKD